MAESMKDFEKELEESMKKIEEGDILTGTVILSLIHISEPTRP